MVFKCKKVKNEGVCEFMLDVKQHLLEDHCVSNKSEGGPRERIKKRLGQLLLFDAPNGPCRLTAKLWLWVGREELTLVTTDLIQEPQVFHLGISPTTHSWKV